MKKIYKTLAVVAFALMSNIAFGQNLKVTANGNPVANGDVIELPYELEEDYYPEFDMTFYTAMWNPHLEVSTVDGSATLTVTLTSVDAEAFQLCWPDGCQYALPGQSVSSKGTIGTIPADLQIHKEQDLDSKDESPVAGGTVKVKLECGSELMEITINALLEIKNGVGENLVDSNLPAVFYTLEGLKVENPSKGIYVVRKGGKARLIYKK